MTPEGLSQIAKKHNAVTAAFTELNRLKNILERMKRSKLDSFSLTCDVDGDDFHFEVSKDSLVVVTLPALIKNAEDRLEELAR